MNPLTPHIRGNARLRRKLDAQAARMADVKRAVGALLVLAAAASIGWVRMSPAEREEVARKIREIGFP